MKGQAPIFSAAAVIVVVAVMTMIGLLIYGQVTDVYPHQQTVNNETLCTTCSAHTLYRFDYIPVLNDTTMICFNGTDNTPALMGRGGTNATALGYNIVGSTDLNLTVIGNAASYYEDVECTYTFDESNTNEQNFYDNNTSVTFSGFTLLSIAAIVLAAVAIVLIIIVLKA